MQISQRAWDQVNDDLGAAKEELKSLKTELMEIRYARNRATRLMHKAEDEAQHLKTQLADNDHTVKSFRSEIEKATNAVKSAEQALEDMNKLRDENLVKHEREVTVLRETIDFLLDRVIKVANPKPVPQGLWRVIGQR